ncbi:toll/interleukin-1 receptor domain-containing protein [Bacillus pseudomycoides]|uniref:Toll/interleukin-1 receptor domain-containing protein n=1 Tax=Bacillus bingmayongensis TaxID=1150157 RepID=A0ABU5K3Q8_9BACI|nr:toll/interleukin-1 receptor domain-containing protein [Bacillus pseudomycoides]
MTDIHQQRLNLITEGAQIKQHCLVPGEYYDYIKGPEYVSWIQRCKRFVNKNVREESFQKDFSDNADKAQAQGDADDRYDNIIGMLQSLEDYDFTVTSNGAESNLTNKIDKIFISHSSKDKEYVKTLVQLLNNIGVEKNKNSIFCSSLPGYDIPHGKSIYEFLKKELKNNNIMILFVLSDNYYQSAPCLNEMGAAWITSKKYTTVLTPNFDFKQIVGAIDPTKISFKMNDPSGLDKFRDDIIQSLELKGTDYKIWQDDKKEYLDAIAQLSDAEASTLNVNIELEKVKKHDKNAIKLDLRFTNVTEKDIEFQYIEIELVDEYGEKFNIVIEDDSLEEILLRRRENKVIEQIIPYDTSSAFQVRRNLSKDAKINFAIL